MKRSSAILKSIGAIVMVLFATMLISCSKSTTSSIINMPTTTPVPSVSNKSNIVEEDTNGYRRFTVTIDEFIGGYDEAIDALSESDYNEVHYLSSYSYELLPIDSATQEMYPNAYQMYHYDTTRYSSQSTRSFSHVVIIVDKENHILEVSLQVDKTISDAGLDFMARVKEPAIYSAIVQKPATSVYAEYGKSISNDTFTYEGDGYGYRCITPTDEYDMFAFVMCVIND